MRDVYGLETYNLELPNQTYTSAEHAVEGMDISIPGVRSLDSHNLGASQYDVHSRRVTNGKERQPQYEAIQLRSIRGVEPPNTT